MLACTARGPAGGVARTSWLSLSPVATSRRLPPVGRSRDISTSSSQYSSSKASSRAYRFWTSDDPLIRALRRRQETYRLAKAPQGARHKADRLEAVQLAKSEIRWIVEHVRKFQGAAAPTKTKSTLTRASRRELVSMTVLMTRHNVPISYLLGSVPFGSLSQELTVRPPILLPRPETEYWATEVVNALLEKLSPAQLEEVRVVDLCTGSGCIVLLIADALRARVGQGKKWRVIACDQSELAVELARENAVKLGFSVNEHQSNVHIVKADVFDDAAMDQLAKIAGGPFHLIVSNPPYIPRREWESLPSEVKQHEDPAALIGERDIASIASPAAQRSSSDARQSYLDRHGLAFHQRLAELLYRATFSIHLPQLPRLVAEYGKGQQKLVERLYAELQAPRDRMPKVVRVEGHLVLVGVGNATTHPLTRHSIGQVVLDPLLAGLSEQDRKVRARLREWRDELQQARQEAIGSGRIQNRPDWDRPVPNSLAVYAPRASAQSDTPEQLDLTPSSSDRTPLQLTKVTKGKGGGWSATLTLLIPSSPVFFTSSALRATPDDVVYQVQVSLYKPSQPMNLSGVGLKAFLNSYHPHPPPPSTGWRISDDVLVLQDELDLAFGEVKRKDVGSARGHNGVRDIIQRLDIPTSSPITSSSSSSGKSKQKDPDAAPKLSRLRIGIGRPASPSPPPASSANSWLPSSLTRGKKPIPIDRWVLSALTPAELDSCRTAAQHSVLSQVQSHTLQWLSDRCRDLSSREARAPIASRKDQFGIPRTVWIH